jgi:hypothetical protein
MRGEGGLRRRLNQWVQLRTLSSNNLWRSNSILNLWLVLLLTTYFVGVPTDNGDLTVSVVPATAGISAIVGITKSLALMQRNNSFELFNLFTKVTTICIPACLRLVSWDRLPHLLTWKLRNLSQQKMSQPLSRYFSLLAEGFCQHGANVFCFLSSLPLLPPATTAMFGS